MFSLHQDKIHLAQSHFSFILKLFVTFCLVLHSSLHSSAGFVFGVIGGAAIWGIHGGNRGGNRGEDNRG